MKKWSFEKQQGPHCGLKKINPLKNIRDLAGSLLGDEQPLTPSMSGCGAFTVGGTIKSPGHTHPPMVLNYY